MISSRINNTLENTVLGRCGLRFATVNSTMRPSWTPIHFVASVKTTTVGDPPFSVARLPELITRSNEQLVFPFVFLWRHHVELYLKFLLELAREHQGQTGDAAKVHTPD